MPSFPDGFNNVLFGKYRICPSSTDNEPDSIYVGSESDLSILGFLKFHLRRQLRIIPVSNKELTRRIQELTGNNSLNKNKGSVERNPNPEVGISLSAIKLIDGIIQKGISAGASDIHFEPFEQNMTCRYRIDGVLRHDRNIVRESIPEVLARIKIMSDLDISERRRPQDGRIRFKAEGKVVDIRVSILPTDFGEKAVLRILDKTTLRLDMGLLGLTDNQQGLLEEKVLLSNGMILVTGPTGSGKTTTLYAILNRLRSPGVNITTIEDPIEYNLEGINQTQIKSAINLTFANALRAILRQDPDIIMVGEIRDKETLNQALRAALTGHLVLSTLHTNDAASTIIRMLDLGAESFLLGSTLKLIIAQRLVQTICPKCKTEGTTLESGIAAEKLALDQTVRLFHGLGCDKCGGTGFLGRTALFEMVPIDSELASLISANRPESELRAFAREKGFPGLKEAGIEKIRIGVTTPLEVLRTVAS